jgi:hypothetical protein
MDHPPINLNASPIEVRHADLLRVDDSKLKSHCPACEQGILLVHQNQTTLELEAEDVCILCGQRIVYTDINTLRERELGQH